MKLIYVEIIAAAVLLGLAAYATTADSEELPSPACMAFTTKLTTHLIEEAKGTDKEAQIEAAIEKVGGVEALAIQQAKAADANPDGPEGCAMALAFLKDDAIKELARKTLGLE
ncbi:hypothetical protein NDN16_05200 [Aureimonas altamirensis]|uniref:hypothetical protein n=1 Tax=Aureimonas altamirensis TaxID=370622 RepID=UPI002036E9F2|nr:hypothetical protein [Aureimonas altamirensis]MCM2503073.1 hypothetical protein [Aureimonas altamirensis]